MTKHLPALLTFLGLALIVAAVAVLAPFGWSFLAAGVACFVFEALMDKPK